MGVCMHMCVCECVCVCEYVCVCARCLLFCVCICAACASPFCCIQQMIHEFSSFARGANVAFAMRSEARLGRFKICSDWVIKSR